MSEGKRARPESFGRMSLDFGSVPAEHVYTVPEAIISLIFSEEVIRKIDGIDLQFKIRSTPSNHAGSMSYEFSLITGSTGSPTCVATLCAEETYILDDAKKNKLVVFPVTSIQKLSGVKSDLSTKLLASCVGAFFSRLVVKQAQALLPGYSIEVTLMLDAQKSQPTVEAYWEIEAALERYLQPYSKKTLGYQMKITSKA